MEPPAAPPPTRRGRPTRALGATVVVLVGVILIGGGLLGRAIGSGTPTAGPTAGPTSSGPATPGAGSPTVGASGQATPGSSPSTGVADKSRGYLVSPSDLAERASNAGQHQEPWEVALKGLLADADEALAGTPQPAINLDIPGTEGPFVDDTASAYNLGLAYALTGDVRYAAKAREYITAWTSTTKRLLNACPDDGACQTSLIVGRVVAGFVFAADLIRPSGVMTADDDRALRAWLRDLILPDLSTRSNNWGDAGNFSRAVINDYLDDQTGFQDALAEWKTRMDLVAADGHIPEEVRRGTAGLSYSQEALQYKIGVARLAELRGIDLWSYQGAKGGSLDKALGLVRTYWFDPGRWPWNGNVTVPSPSPMWELAYQHFKDLEWGKVFAGDRPYGHEGHSAIRWTTLTNGIPIR